MPTLPPMPPPCAGWRSGACAIRPSWRHGTSRAAPTACSSTSRAARICSAGRSGCWPISSARLRAFGLFPRTAIADTAGAAWAVARHGARDGTIVASGDERAALQALPLAALRLGEEGLLLMRRLGLRRIGEVMHQPRAPFAARFQPELLRRLDQALGRAPEPLVPVVEPPVYRAQAAFARADHGPGACAGGGNAPARGSRPRPGARCRRRPPAAAAAVPSRVEDAPPNDSGVVSLDLGLAAPSRDARHIAQLIGLRLHRLGSELEADFGFEAAAVHVLVAESLAERQDRLGLGEANIPPEELARLIDRLQQRLGRGAVRQLHPQQSHIPERAVRARRRFSLSPFFTGRGSRVRGSGSSSGELPLTLTLSPLKSGERDPSPPARCSCWSAPRRPRSLAVVPDGPPRHFRWRGVLHQVAEAQGPERITPEWWRRTAERTRDYYVVEDVEGRRFWLYRAGLYGRGGPTPQWFVHGVFG